MGNKALDLATTMVLRDTKPGRTCPIPVNFEGVGGLKVIDHCDCGGCYFEGDDCPNIDSNLLCSRNGKTVVYMPVPADEMGACVSGSLTRMAVDERNAPIDRIDEISESLGALTCATSEIKRAKEAFDSASKWYAEARNNWTVAWNNVAAFARSTRDDTAPVPVSVPTVLVEPTAPIPEVTITVTQPYVSTDDALDNVSVGRNRPTLLPGERHSKTVEDDVLAALSFDVPLTVKEVEASIGGKRSTVTNGLARLVGCGLVLSEPVPGSRRALRYWLNDDAERKSAPGSPEERIYKLIGEWGNRTVGGISGLTGIPEKSVCWIAGGMVRAGLLERDDDGLYSLAEGME